MKMRAIVHDNRWQYLAAALDARWLLPVFFIAMLTRPFYTGIHQDSFLDHALFRLGIQLQNQVPDATAYVRVDVPADEMQRFLHDPVSATGMMPFLAQLQSSNIRSARLVLHEKLWTEYKTNMLLEHASAVDAPLPLNTLPDIRKNIGIFQSFLTDRRIVRDEVGVGASLSLSAFPKLPFFSVANGYSVPDASRYGLAQLSDQTARRVLQDKIVVVGETNDAHTDDLLLHIISMDSSNVAMFSPWFKQLHLIIMVCLLVYLLLLPFMPLVFSAVLSLLFMLTFVFAQQILFIVHREWLPVSYWLLFLSGGHCMVFLWCVRRCFYQTSPAHSSGHVPHAMPALVKREPFWKGLRFSRPATMRRVPPTMMSGGHADDFEDTAVSPVMREGGKVRQYLGRYRIERELGRGAMGIVYLGFDPKISRKVAIKTLHYNQFDATELPAVKERFFREAAAAGKLRHPNIVTIYDAGEENDLAYIAMDYVEGVSLASHTKKGQLLDVELVYYIMALVTDAVSEANAQGIIHRDIKPSNILYNAKTNEVKVADFGIARIMDGSATRTKTGELVGSPLYMSPEQIKGDAVGKQSDIFSLGVTFYQLLTGELPFKGDSLANLSYQIVQCKYRAVDEVRPGLPESARRIIAKALQKNPENRYPNADDMHDALQKAYARDF